jgi:adenylate cyclase
MGAKLHIQPKNAEAFEVLIGNTATIGRTRDNTVCLHFSPLVSRQHALIRGHGDFRYQVIDLGSRNGTYVNEQRVVMPVILEPGAQIRIADNTLTFIKDEEEDEDVGLTVAGSMMGSMVVRSRPVALLVCDIRGFSTMSEQIPSADLAQLLGKWFREASNAIQSSHGTIDKFIGDAVLAYWAGNSDGEVDCNEVFSVARKLVELAGEMRWPEGEPFRIAVALHYGPVTFSDMGMTAERDATIIGDAVNTVFRLEAVSKEVSRSVVLSNSFADQLSNRPPLEDFGDRTLKGKSQTVQVFGLPEIDPTVG